MKIISYGGRYGEGGWLWVVKIGLICTFLKLDFRTIFTVFSYDAVLDQDSNPSLKVSLDYLILITWIATPYNPDTDIGCQSLVKIN